uniref:Clathrin/coatomer adaptor adaptin-like N-terminal domain-containing protein n=1 Tax=Plectus sambesii TaxID=2011161 RepID=A0A914VTL4_9BILA
MKRDKKDEEAGAVNVYANLDKTTVLQEARVFNETPINPRKCALILTKLLYLLQQGETIGRTEATEAFFAVTKLWQSKDANLRRLVFLAIKELCDKADDVIIVTSSLTKDMTGKEDMYRAAAIRALCRITDGNMLQAIERYMKQAIVDKVPAVASAALVSSLHLMKRSPEVVRRWVNEVQEAVSSDNHMVQFHALGVLYHIRKTDRLAVNKLVQKFSKSGLKSPYAICYLIRLASKLIEEDDAGSLFHLPRIVAAHSSFAAIHSNLSPISGCRVLSYAEKSFNCMLNSASHVTEPNFFVTEEANRVEYAGIDNCLSPGAFDRKRKNEPTTLFAIDKPIVTVRPVSERLINRNNRNMEAVKRNFNAKSKPRKKVSKSR